MIRIIPHKTTYDLRHKILRPGKPLESVFFEEDTWHGSFHLGYFENDKCIGVCSFCIKKHPISHTLGYQLRGMAIDQNFRGKGLGEKLVVKGHQIIKSLGVNTVWCNARVSALKFYQKMGYEINSEVFQISDAGPHVVMSKQIID